MRFRAALAMMTLGLSVATACSFGVDLDGIFGGARDGGRDGSQQDPDGGPPRVDALQITSGNAFGCALRVDGTITCWGYNGEGQLGDGTQFPSSSPVLVKDIGDATQMSAGARHACAVRKGGGVVCWGYNDTRQLGDGSNRSSQVPVPVVQLADAVEVAAGAASSCARRKDGTVMCWGDNTEGQLGDNSTTSRSQPAPVQGLADVIQLASQAYQVCALVKGGDVYCWGDNARGQVGNGAPPNDALVPSKVVKLSGVASIGSGSSAYHTCAVLLNGEVRCWGVGSGGALGAGGGGDSAEPVAVVAVNDAVAVSAGDAFTCAARKSGASCWGDNTTRQLGVGDSSPPSSVSSPVPVVGLAAPTQVSAGGGYACALLPGGKISCWGDNTYGRLGRGTRVYSATPVKVAKLSEVKQVALGGSHGCAVAAGGAVSCWGNNSNGQLGGAPIEATGTPTPIASLTSGATQAGGGDYHACAVVGGQVRCWGYGYYGNLGHGKNEGSATPVVFGAGPATDVSAGYHFTCALLATTEVACSGLAADGRLGQPGGNLNVPGKVVVGGTVDGGGPTYLTGVSKLSSNGGHSCVLAGTTVRCWGENDSGECGTTGATVPAPFQVTLPPAKDVATGGAHSCALLTDGTVRCWGSASYGQLGSGTSGGPNPQPAVDFGGKTVKAIALGDSHTCALSDDGAVYCWGRGRFGQVGNGVRADTPRPAQVTGLSGVVSIAAHGETSCAVLGDGTAQCWGSNYAGQLGDGGEFVSGTAASVVGY